jgi:hypothetical protein
MACVSRCPDSLIYFFLKDAEREGNSNCLKDGHCKGSSSRKYEQCNFQVFGELERHALRGCCTYLGRFSLSAVMLRGHGTIQKSI